MSISLLNLSRVFLVSSLVVLSSVFFSSCEEEEEEDNKNNSAGFDRTAMLTEVADHLIIPRFENLEQSVSNLHNAITTFNTTSNQANLEAIRTAWIAAVNDHQHCSAFGFGPGALLLGPYANVIAAFPVNESKVEENILDDSFDLANSFSVDVRGFYTIEYLIYREGMSDQEIIDSFDMNRKDYLLLIANELKDTFEDIVGEWNSTYRSEFIENNGTSAGSSISLYYNEFVKDYENLKNYKVELPAGLSAGQTGADPKLVEAYYSGISRDLIIEHFESSKNIWSGTDVNGQDILGFEEYLETLVGGPELIDQTKTTIGEIDELISSLPSGELSENLDAQVITDLRNKLQENTANFKSSLSSLLGISITFNSGDGD